LKEIFREYAEELHRRGFDTVILGHLHLPEFEQGPSAARPGSPPAQTYANLGDWVRWRTFLRWEDGRLELRQWNWPEAVERPFRPG
jgi:UDP-2,3-diacylglucosamine pyrophosphatase LpxH